LRLADLLADGPRNVDGLARDTATDPPSLYRLLRALASNGIFREGEPGTFELTPLAEGLRSDIPGSLRAMCVLRTEAWAWAAWSELLRSVSTGISAMELLDGRGLFDFLEERPESLSLFAQEMVSLSSTETEAILAAYDFSGYSTIIDIGGGTGTILAAILAAYPAASGVLFDQPSVIDRAGPLLDGAGISHRCTRTGGDFFAAVPGGGDFYLLKSIIHDWDDERAEAILRTCRCAMPPHARLMLIERVVPAGNGPSFAKWMDLNMLVIAGGRERTEAEYRHLYARAGLELRRIIPTASDMSLIEGVPIGEIPGPG
jgi:hypothetical protein